MDTTFVEINNDLDLGRLAESITEESMLILDEFKGARQVNIPTYCVLFWVRCLIHRNR